MPDALTERRVQLLDEHGTRHESAEWDHWVADLDDAALAKWQALAKPVWKDYADKNENCAKLLALAQKLL